MASDRDREVENLLGDIETRKFLYEEDLATQVDPEQLVEDAKVLKELEARLQVLLGTNDPHASIVQDAQSAPSQRPASTVAHTGASTASSRTASASPSASNSPARLPARDEYGSPYHQLGSTPRQNWRADVVTAGPIGQHSTPHNSASTSMSLSQPHRGQRAYSPSTPDLSRKRPRHDSIVSPIAAPSKRQALITDYESRMEELSEELDRKLASIRADYEVRKTDTDDLEFRALAGGISIREVLEALEEEQEEEERVVRRDINLERDGAMARKLQAEDLNDDSPGGYPFSPPTASPRLPLDRPPLRPDPRLMNDGFRPASSIPLGYNPYASGSSSGSSMMGTPGPGYFARPPVLASQSWDDDLQEISGEAFKSRFGSPFRDPRAYGFPRLPGGFPGPRQFPWTPHIGQDPAGLAMSSLDEAKMDLEDDDLERYEEQKFPEDIRNLITGIKDIRVATQADKDESPSALKVTLMKHQKIGLRWMKAKEESSQKGGILADDMGLGKTIQAIALITARPPTKADRHPCLIVAPKALMEQWRLEIARHVNPGKQKLSVFIFHDKTRRTPWRDLCKFDIIITTFGTLTANHKLLLKGDEAEKAEKDSNIVKLYRDQAVLFTPKSKFHRIIVDEAQNIKNPLAKSNKACCALNATYRWCLTGTPMMNKLDDLQALLKYLRIRPYSVKDKFKRDFPVRSGMVDDNVMKQLRVLVKSVCLRRTKTSQIDGQPILQLPPKVIEKVHVVFNELEQEAYTHLNDETQKKITKYINSGTLLKNYTHVLVLLLRLRQACCHPLLLDINTDGANTVSGIDLVANANLLAPEVVARIKSLDEEGDEEAGTCPICMDSSGNAIIYIPCGHSVCTECFARVSDPTVLARDDTSGLVKCQNCRGQVDPEKVTDLNSFKKAHDPDSVPEDAQEKEDSDEDSDAEYDSEDSQASTRKPKRKSLAALRKAGQKSQKERRKYLRRLEKSWIPSSKIEKSLEILQANEDRGNGEKTIIFSQFTSLLDLLEVPLKRRGWKHVRFDGSMKVEDRNASVAGFTDDPDTKIMLVSLKAGNSGLNLVAASHVIIFDPFWNPYVEDQAIDRAHRIGQTKEVFVHRLLIERTVEDRIIELQEQKRELIGGALDEGGSMNVTRLSGRDLAYLFGIQDA